VSEADLRRDLRGFITDRFLPLGLAEPLADDDDLVDAGILDSLAFVELVEEIQSRYGVRVEDVEVTEENFGSVAALAGYVAGKRGT
jgi:acyl carrier protein